MLAFAIILTVICAICLIVGFGLAGYVVLTKIREIRGNSRQTDSTEQVVAP